MKVIKIKRVKKADASDPSIQKLDDAFYAVYTPFKQTVQKNKSRLEDVVKKLGDVVIFWKQKKDEHDHIMPSKYPGGFTQYYEREEEIEKNIASASELLKHLRFMISEMKSWM